jgi:DNA modification methylase
MSKQKSSSFSWFAIVSNFNTWWRYMVAFQQHWKQRPCIIFFHHKNNLCSWPIKKETNLNFKNLGSNVRNKILWVLFSSYFVRNERKPFKTSHVFWCWKQT